MATMTAPPAMDRSNTKIVVVVEGGYHAGRQQQQQVRKGSGGVVEAGAAGERRQSFSVHHSDSRGGLEEGSCRRCNTTYI